MLQQINNLNLLTEGLHQPHLLLQLYIHFISLFQNSVKCTLTLTLPYFKHWTTYSFWAVQAASGGCAPDSLIQRSITGFTPLLQNILNPPHEFIIIILGVLAIWTLSKCYLSIFDVNCLPEFINSYCVALKDIQKQLL